MPLNETTTLVPSEGGVKAGPCEAPSFIPRWLGIFYSVTYGVFFFIVALISFQRTQVRSRGKKYTICKRLCVWLTEIWYKRTTYFPLITHIVDQASDITVISQFYLLWQIEDGNYKSEKYKSEQGLDQNNNDLSGYCQGMDMKWMFILSMSIFIEYRIISSLCIFYYTRSFLQLFSQLFDLEFIRAIALNWKYSKLKPNTIQLYIQSMESIFESAPQSLINFIFLIETGALHLTNSTGIIVFIGFLFSLWSIMWRIVVDDKPLFPIYARKHHFNPNFCYRMNVRDPNKEIQYCCFLSFPYCLRILFRIADVTLRIITCGLLYLSLSARILIVVFCIEFLILLMISIKVGKWSLMGAFITVRMSTDLSSILLFFYRAFINLFLMILITIYEHTKNNNKNNNNNNDNDNNDDNDRNKNVIFEGNRLAMVLFVYCWIMVVLFPFLYIYIDRDISSKMATNRSSLSNDRDLHSMIREGKEVPIRDALDFGWYPHKKDKSNLNCYPIHTACECGEYKVLKLLIHYGAHIDAKDSQMKEPIHYACQFGHYKCVKRMIKAGSDINVRDKLGRTPIIMALIFAKSMDRSKIQTLHRRYHGSDDEDECDGDYDDRRRRKRKNNKSTKHKKYDSHHHSSRYRTIKNKKKNKKKHRSKHHNRETKRGMSSAMRIIRYLIDNGAQSTVSDIHGKGVLHYASESGDRAIVEIIFNHDSFLRDVNAKDRDGWSPLHYACNSGMETTSKDSRKTVEFLLKNGANPFAQSLSDRKTSLHLAVNSGNNEVCSLLLQAALGNLSANSSYPVRVDPQSTSITTDDECLPTTLLPNITDNKGNSPLHIACKLGFMDIVELLLKYEANPDLKNNRGLRCFEMANATGVRRDIEAMMKRIRIELAQSNAHLSSASADLGSLSIPTLLHTPKQESPNVSGFKTQKKGALKISIGAVKSPHYSAVSTIELVSTPVGKSRKNRTDLYYE